MNNSQSKPINLFNASYPEVLSLFRPDDNPERKVKRLIFLLGFLTGPLTVLGIIWGFKVSYNKLLRPKDLPPTLAPLYPASKRAMILGVFLAWGLTFLGLYCLYIFVSVFFSARMLKTPLPFFLIFFNSVISAVLIARFSSWSLRIQAQLDEATRFGSGRVARPEELEDLTEKDGIFIGGHYNYHRQGNLLACAAPRSGKLTSLIAPHLLGRGGYKGSTIAIDPKGEAYAISHRYQESIGQRVIVLDPWLVQATPDEVGYYNPLDLLSADKGGDHLSDDCDLIAEMLIPKGIKDDQFFLDRARSLITGFILRIVLEEPEEKRNLTTLWEYLRLPEDQFNSLVEQMADSENPVIRATAFEILNNMEKGEKTFSSILSTAHAHTDFLKSEALQRSMRSSSFDVNTLSDGMTTLYVIIPPDQLETPNAKWLRLIVSTTLMAVVRNKNKRVTFILDEFASLGFMPIVKTAMSMYSGYNVTIWPILQSLIQLKHHYGDDWEVFLACAAVKSFFSLGDHFSCSYLSQLLGSKTVVTYKPGTFGPEAHSTERPLFTADEIRRGSADNMFTLIEQRPVTYFPKVPYFQMPELAGRYDPNPYYENIRGEDDQADEPTIH